MVLWRRGHGRAQYFTKRPCLPSCSALHSSLPALLYPLGAWPSGAVKSDSLFPWLQVSSNNGEHPRRQRDRRRERLRCLCSLETSYGFSLSRWNPWPTAVCPDSMTTLSLHLQTWGWRWWQLSLFLDPEHSFCVCFIFCFFCGFVLVFVFYLLPTILQMVPLLNCL